MSIIEVLCFNLGSWNTLTSESGLTNHRSVVLQSLKTSITFQTGLTYHRSVVFQSFKTCYIRFQTGLTYHRSVVFQSCFVTVGVSGGYFHGLGLRGQAHAQQFRLKTFLRGIEEDINDLYVLDK